MANNLENTIEPCDIVKAYIDKLKKGNFIFYDNIGIEKKHAKPELEAMLQEGIVKQYFYNFCQNCQNIASEYYDSIEELNENEDEPGDCFSCDNPNCFIQSQYVKV